MRHFIKRTVSIVMALCMLSSTLVFASSEKSQGVDIVNIKTQGADNPLGLEETPRFSWNYISTVRGFTQSAYRIIVSTTEQKAISDDGDLWDSKKIESNDTIDINYEGEALTSGQRCYWKVIGYDNFDNSVSSGVAFFEMGLTDNSDWGKAEWIGKRENAPSNVPAKTEKWIDYTVSTDVTIISSNASVIFRALYATQQHYKLEIDLGSSEQFKVYKTGYSNELLKSYTTKDIIANKNYNIKITANKNSFDFYLDGVKINDVSLVDDTYKSGSVGVGALSVAGEWGNAKFDNFIVKQGEDILFSDDFTDSTINNFQDCLFIGGGKCQPENGYLSVYALTALIEDKSDMAAPLLRKEFQTTKAVKSARAYVSGIGYYEMTLNGEKVGDAILEPGYSRYDKTVYYSSYDVTELITARNTVGFELGRGWYSITTPTLWGEFRATDWISEPKVKAIIKIQYTDGTIDEIVTDSSFKVGDSPIVFDSLKAGEIHDARKEKTGWNTVGYDDSGWEKAVVVKSPLASTTEQNVAINKTGIAESSTEQWGWAKANMLDGEKKSTAASMGYTNDLAKINDATKWVGVDLGQTYDITKLNLYPRTDIAGGFFPTNFDVQISNDGVNWTTIKEVRGVADDTAVKVVELEKVNARQVRINGLNMQGINISLSEFEVLAKVTEVSDKKLELHSQMFPPIREVEQVKAVSVKPIGESGAYAVDFGRHMAGNVELKVSGTEGNKIKIQYAERVDSNDNPIMYPFDPVNSGCYQQDTYILKGGSEETYQAKFSYKGFRYLVVTGFETVPSVDNFTAKVINSDMAENGTFDSSSDLFNKISLASKRSIQSNVYSIPTDCPTFEKLGWTCDDAAPMEAMIYYYDIKALYEKRLNDYADDISADGSISDVLPSTWGLKDSDPAWNGSYIAIAYKMYKYYGNTDILRKHYDNMKKYLDNLTKSATQEGNPQYIVTPNEDKGYGDWCPPDHVGGRGPDGVSLYHTTYYYWYTEMMSEIAEVIGEASDANLLKIQSEKIKTAINNRYFDETENAYYFPEHKGGFRQSAQVLPLYFGIVPEGKEQAVADRLAADIKARDNHLWVGILGIEYIADVLTKFGYTDLAYKIHLQTDNPSIGNMISQGATTLWESYSLELTRSLNHKMYSTISEWFFKQVAGLGVDGNTTEFKKATIAPKPYTEKLTYANAKYTSVQGDYASGWRYENNKYYYDVEVPANATATLQLPVMNYTNIIIKENGTTIWNDNGYVSGVMGINSGTANASTIDFEIGSGKYSFTFEGKETAIEADSVSVSPKQKQIVVGENLTLVATISPDNTTDKAVSWSSSDETVATVSATGVVTAKKSGTAIITASTANNKTSVSTITVINKAALVDDLDDFTKVFSKSDNLTIDSGIGENAIKAATNDNQYIVYQLENTKYVKAKIYGVADGQFLANSVDIYTSQDGISWTKQDINIGKQTDVGVWAWKTNEIESSNPFPLGTRYVKFALPTIMTPDLSAELPDTDAWRVMLAKVELYNYDELVQGDVNGDNVCNIIDLVALKKWLQELKTKIQLPISVMTAL